MRSDDKPTVTENEELEVLAQKVLKVRGLGLREYSREKLRRSVQERFAANNLTSYKEYIELLDRRPDEDSVNLRHDAVSLRKRCNICYQF